MVVVWQAPTPPWAVWRTDEVCENYTLKSRLPIHRRLGTNVGVPTTCSKETVERLNATHMMFVCVRYGIVRYVGWYRRGQAKVAKDTYIFRQSFLVSIITQSVINSSIFKRGPGGYLFLSLAEFFRLSFLFSQDECAIAATYWAIFQH